MLYTSHELRVQPGRNLALDLPGSGVILGDTKKEKKPKNAVFLPVTESSRQRIPQGMNKMLTVQVVDSQIQIEPIIDGQLYLILSSRLLSGDGRGALYTLKNQYAQTRILSANRFTNPYQAKNRWGEIVVQAQPQSAFFATWKRDGEIVADRLYYVDDTLTVYATEQKQAYMQFKANGIEVPFRFNTRNGQSSARILRADWHKIV